MNGGEALPTIRAMSAAAQSQLHQVHHVTHPLVQHKLTLMRDREASSTTFRTLLGELAMLMAYEVTRDMPVPALGPAEVMNRCSLWRAPRISGRASRR